MVLADPRFLLNLNSVKPANLKRLLGRDLPCLLRQFVRSTKSQFQRECRADISFQKWLFSVTFTIYGPTFGWRFLATGISVYRATGVPFDGTVGDRIDHVIGM